jgi:hypothetical protein
MEIGMKPIPISVLTAVTNSALNAASVFPYQFEPIGRHSDIQVMDAGLQDFEVATTSCPIAAWTASDRFRIFETDLQRDLPQLTKKRLLTKCFRPRSFFSGAREVTQGAVYVKVLPATLAFENRKSSGNFGSGNADLRDSVAPRRTLGMRTQPADEKLGLVLQLELRRSHCLVYLKGCSCIPLPASLST